MSKVETPVSGGDGRKGAPDGVSDSPGKADANVQGRSDEGESGGGAYPNPHTGKTPTGGGFMGHGGQTEMAYHGGGQAGEQGGDAPNAATGSDTSDGQERGAAPPPVPDRESRRVTGGGGQSFEVMETDGVAQAEASGKIGTDSSQDPNKSAGSG